jgi:autophagy-related protein 101
MDVRRAPPEYSLSIFADPATITPLLKSVLHTIFFHRYFPTVRPSTHEILHLTLPYVDDPELSSLIDSRVHQLTRQLSSTSTPNNSVRGQIGIQFFEKRRRKGGGGGVGMAWFGVRNGNGEEEVCWEVWRLEVTLATPRTQEGEFFQDLYTAQS